jgi:hypothetical protein
MATSTSSNANKSGGTSRASTRRTASASSRRASAKTSRSTSPPTRRSTRSSSPRSTASATSARAQARTNQAQNIAERAVLVPVGASLLAQENIVSSVRDLATKYTTRGSLERELKRYERRGATARNRFERQVRKTRTRFERELRQRRSSVERTVKQNRRRIEREVRSARKDPAGTVSAQAARLISNAQELLSSAS